MCGRVTLLEQDVDAKLVQSTSSVLGMFRYLVVEIGWLHVAEVLGIRAKSPFVLWNHLLTSIKGPSLLRERGFFQQKESTLH